MATACYTAPYLPSSFKGVPFESIEASSVHGRRGAVGEFAFGETTAYGDLGRKNRTYSISARLVENNHVIQAAALIAAVESPGAGILVHPTRGVVNAACTTLTIRDSVLEEQGISYADMEFVEANEWPAGLSFGSAISSLAINAVIAAASAVFLGAYDPRSAPYHRRAAVTNTAANIIATIRDEYARATAGDISLKRYRALSDFDTIISDDVLLQDKYTVKDAIVLGISAVAATLGGASKFDAMKRIVNAAAEPPLPGRAGAIQEATILLTRVVAGTYLAQAGTEKTYTTSDEAFQYLDTAVLVLDSEAQISYQACSNDLFLELRRFTVQTQSAIYQRAFTLPGLIEYQFNGAKHPLVAAYDIWGDAKRHRELEVSNLISHTGRIGGSIVAVGA